jgi:hypothetical protein
LFKQERERERTKKINEERILKWKTREEWTDSLNGQKSQGNENQGNQKRKRERMNGF